MQPEEMLPDGTPCKTGFCNKGVCEPTMTDIVVRIWGFFEDFNVSSVMRFLRVCYYLFRLFHRSKAIIQTAETWGRLPIMKKHMFLFLDETGDSAAEKLYT